MLRKFQTVPNISLSHSYPNVATIVTCTPFGAYKYAATEVATDSHSAGTEDEEMTDCSGVTSDTESIETSIEDEQGRNSGKASSSLKRNEEQVVQLEYESSLLQDPGECFENGEENDTTSPWDLSEWKVNGGLFATQAAFEGTFLLEASLDAVAEWSATIVWKMFLRQAQQCTSANRHQITIPQDAPCPRFLPKLLTKAMPRYKGGMTRAIIVTYALLYLHRIKTCFHCTRSPNSASADATTECGKNAPAIDVASQCSLFFSVGMHYASLWLLDCCPAEKVYWKRYVHCVSASHGVAWSRLVLQHWNYQINVTVEDWLSFCSQVLARFPFVDEKIRHQLANNEISHPPMTESLQ